MEIIGKEIIAAENKYIHRKGSDAYFKRCLLLKRETIENFEEVDNLPDSEVGQARIAKINEITQYDTSSAVNEFYLDELPMWLDKDTRVGLMNSTTIEKAAGNKTTTLWFGTTSFKIDCDKAIEMLSALEIYALACYNKTAEHKANVEKLVTKKEVEDYNYKEGYPEKLKLKSV